MRRGRVLKGICLEHEMDMSINAEEFSLDTSFACNRERKHGLSHLYRYLVFQGSTDSCKHIETI